jgi:FtsP/CotA-like multicopper oxidase with cupredoxin domain
VLEPGESFNPARDHVYLSIWHGPPLGLLQIPGVLINGDSIGSAPQELEAGVTHRFRLINIGPAGVVRHSLRLDTTLVQWKARAKDGADLPQSLRVMQAAVQPVSVGETYDFEFVPPGPGTYEISAIALMPPSFPGVAGPQHRWRQLLVVR